VVLGHANGKIKGGQHIKYPQDSRHADLLLTLLQRNEIPVKSIGDSADGPSEVSVGKLLAIAALLAGTSMLVADTAVTRLDAAESGDHAAAMRLVSAKGTNVNVI